MMVLMLTIEGGERENDFNEVMKYLSMRRPGHAGAHNPWRSSLRKTYAAMRKREDTACGRSHRRDDSRTDAGFRSSR
jgi:hypothetical protein